MTVTEEDDDDIAYGITYVLVPSDTTKPLEEFIFHPKHYQKKKNNNTTNETLTTTTTTIMNYGSGQDLLLEHLKPAFASSGDSGKGSIDIDLLKKHSTSTTLSSSLGNNNTNDSILPSTVSDETLRKVAAEANIEIFTLAKPTPSNDFTSVNIYLDEGMCTTLNIFLNFRMIYS